MRRIWKELVILCGFISIYCFLIFEHEQHRHGIVIKEIPYILILIVTIVFVLWGIDKLKQYQTGNKVSQKMRRLSDQYDLQLDESKPVTSNCDYIMDQLNQIIKQHELNLSMYEYRYRLIADITNQVIFEYNLRNHTMCDSKNWHVLVDADHFINETIAKEYVHPDDTEIFRTYFEKNHMVNQINEVVIRIRTRENPAYHAVRIRGIVLEGLDGKPEKIIGARIPVERVRESQKKTPE